MEMWKMNVRLLFLLAFSICWDFCKCYFNVSMCVFWTTNVFFSIFSSSED